MKNSNLVMAGVGVAAVGYLAYCYFKTDSQTLVSPYSVSPNQGPTMGGQPSLQYPFSVATPPRVDGSNQPWYGGDRSGLQVTQLNQMNPTAELSSNLNSVNSIIGSTQEIWDSLGLTDVFGGEEVDSMFDLESDDEYLTV